MTSQLLHGVDQGHRCDRHIGEVFPPRCSDCDIEALKFVSDSLSRRLGFIPGSECAQHHDYPLPCARCARDREEALDEEIQARILTTEMGAASA